VSQRRSRGFELRAGQHRMRQLIDTTVLLHERGVELRSLTESIDTTTPSGKLTFHIFAALSEFERDLLRQRVNAGLKAARRRGARGRQAEGAHRGGSQEGTGAVGLRGLHQRSGCPGARSQPPYALARFVAEQGELSMQLLKDKKCNEGQPSSPPCVRR
jgi:hypothetical protein